MNEIEQTITTPNTAEQAEPAQDTMAADVQERLRALEEREAALNLRERQARIRAELNGRELPETLIGCLDLSSDERADASLETLANAFNNAVTRRVRDRLGAEPPRAAAAIPDALAAVRRAMGLN